MPQILLTSYISVITFVVINGPILIHKLSIQVMLYSDIFRFILMTFSCSSCHVSLGSSWLCQFLGLSLFLITLTVWESLVRYFIENPSVGICLMFSSWLDWGYEFWEEDLRGRVPFSSHHINVHSITLITLIDVNLDDLAWNGVYPGFVTVKFLFFLPCHTVLFGRKSLCTVHT